MVSGCSDSAQKEWVGAVVECRVRECRQIARGHSALGRHALSSVLLRLRHRDAGNPDKAAWGCYSAMKLSDSVEDLFEDDTTDSFQIAAKQLIEEMSDNQMDGTPYDLPREYQSALHLQLHHLRDYLAKTYEGDHDFVVRVNSAQQSWRAKVYAQFVGKPLRDLQLMSGYKPTRRAFDGLRPVRSSLLEIDEGTLPKTFDWRNKDGQVSSRTPDSTVSLIVCLLCRTMWTRSSSRGTVAGN